MNLQDVSAILETEFWREYSKRMEVKKNHILHSFCNDGIEKQEQWLRHARYQGELAVFDWVRELPNQIIKDLKQGTLG